MVKSLGRAIRELREQSGVSITALARASKLSHGEISRIELEGRTNLRFSTVCTIAHALGLSLDDLATRAGLLRNKPIQEKRVTITMAKIVAKLDAVESLSARISREVARLKEQLG